MTPEHVLGVDSTLDLEEPLVIATPELALPVGYGRMSLFERGISGERTMTVAWRRSILFRKIAGERKQRRNYNGFKAYLIYVGPHIRGQVPHWLHSFLQDSKGLLPGGLVQWLECVRSDWDGEDGGLAHNSEDKRQQGVGTYW